MRKDFSRRVCGVFVSLLFFWLGICTRTWAATNLFDFTYASRQELLADGWDFLARTAAGQMRDTETTSGNHPPDISYDQGAHPGALRIPVGDGDLWATANNTVNSLFRNLSSNWVSLQLSLSFTPTANYQQAHLALYQDDDNYIEIGHAYNGSVGGEGVLFVIENGGVQLGSPRIINRVGVVNSSVYLRLERDLTNDFVRGLYSHNGTNWTSLGEISHEFVNPRLCIWAGGSAGGAPLVCDLREMEVVTSDVPLQPVLTTAPARLLFNAVAGEACTNAQELRVIARRSQTALNWTLTPSAAWLSVNATNGSTPGTTAVAVDTSGLSPGIYQATLACAGTGVVSATTEVTLVINPATRVRAATWSGGSKGAMTVSVDDSRESGFEKLNANGLKGTYLLWGLSSYNPFAAFYAAGMELGAHTVDHPCFAVNEPTRRYELEANIAGIVNGAGVPAAEIISFAWPCGFTTIKDQVIAADYFLSARGYNFNELEDAQPRNWMNLKNFNSHENDPHEFNPAAPDNPADLKTMADAAETQGKWFNLVLHTLTNDDDAIPYSRQKDLWVAPLGSVVKYMQLRDRTVWTNYVETATNLSFQLSRLSLDASRLRSFETAVQSNDLVTLQVDVTDLPSVGNLTVAGGNTSYRVRDAAAQRWLLFDVAVTTNPVPVVLTIGDGTPVAVAQRFTVAEDAATNIALFGTGMAGHALTYEIVAAPSHGGLTGAAPNLTYTPVTNFHGVDVFTFRVVDTVSSLAATGAVRVAVFNVNDAPLVQHPFPAQQGTYGTPFLAFATNVFWDADEEELTYSAVGLPPGISISAAGTINGIPTQAGEFIVHLTGRDGRVPHLWVTNDFTFVVGKASAPLGFGNLAQVYDGTARAVAVTTEPAGLTVNLTYDGETSAPTNAGSYQVIAVLAESNYEGAATNQLIVAPSNAPVQLGNLNAIYSGAAHAVTVTTVPPDLNVIVTYGGGSAAPTNAGNYEVIAAVAELNYSGGSTNTLTIVPASAQVNLTDLNQWFNGTPRAVMAATEPSGLAVHLTYDGSHVPPIVAGDYEVIGIIAETNFTGAATNTLNVVEVPLVITNVALVGPTEVAVTWQTVPDFTYQLQYKDELEVGDWQAIIPTITATNEFITVTNSVGNQLQRYYRVLLVP